MNIIKIKNKLVNLNEINAIIYDENTATIDVYFKTGLLISIDADELYFKDLYNRINNML